VEPSLEAPLVTRKLLHALAGVPERKIMHNIAARIIRASRPANVICSSFVLCFPDKVILPEARSKDPAREF